LRSLTSDVIGNPQNDESTTSENAGEGLYDGRDMIPGSGLGAELRLANLATSNVDPAQQAKTNVRHPRNDAVTDDGPALRIRIDDYSSSASRSATWRFIFRRAKRFVSVATARRRIRRSLEVLAGLVRRPSIFFFQV
jgi:hypothetical protein